MEPQMRNFPVFIQSPELQIPTHVLNIENPNPNFTLQDLKSCLLEKTQKSLAAIKDSVYFTFDGRPIKDSTLLYGSGISPFSTLVLRFRLRGGGGDGGATGAESRDCYLKMYAVKKPDKIDPNEIRLSRWLNCALSNESLKHPVVIDKLGNLFSMCMRTIMLIENKDQGNNEKVQVDFDDKGSWEYLFKLYWVYLKEKLSLTLSELIQAKNPERQAGRIQGELKYGHHVANVKGEGSIMAQRKMNEKTEAHATNISEKLGYRAIIDQAVDGSGSETSIASLSTTNSASTNISETDEVWHYRDPNGKVQGSFSMTQLRKWSTLGIFPLDMRIWTNDEYNDAVLLNDALNGLFRKAPAVHGKTSSQSIGLGPASDDRNGTGCGSSAGTGRECREWRCLAIVQVKIRMEMLRM